MKTSIGLCGATGKTPELQIGQVKTVEHTQKASVEITGTRENPVLNFNIPKGKDGAKLIVREYFNGDIQILNNLNELPQDTNSDTYGKTVMSVNGIKQLLEKINDVLTKANANTNAIGSLTSTVQGNKSDIETKLNNFKSVTDTKVQSINQTISELEQTIETKLNEELTKQVKALQDENKKLNDMIFENSLKEIFEGSDTSISDTSNGVLKIETIKGQTIVTDAPNETNPNLKLIESVGDKENNKIKILTNGKNPTNPNKLFVNSTTLLKENNEFICPSNVAWQSERITNVDFSKPFCFAYEIKTDEDIIVDGSNSNLFVRLDYAKTGGNVGATNIPLGTKITNKYTKVIFNNITVNQSDAEQGINLLIRNGVGKKLYVRNIIIANDTITDIIPYKEDKKEILVSLDGGLKSLPNGVADTIEQREDGFYLVQRVVKQIFTGAENWLTEGWGDSDDSISFKTAIMNCVKKTPLLCDKFLVGDSSTNGECVWAWASSAGISIRVLKNKLSVLNPTGFKSWLQSNPVTIYYQLETPVETKLDINNLNLKTYKDLTYITSENSIKPVLNGQATKDITTVIKILQSKGAN